MSEQEPKVLQTAEQFIRKYGLLTRASSSELLKKFKSGEVQVKGLSHKEVGEALRIVNAMSYTANKQTYESGGTELNPEAGRAFLDSPERASPVFVNTVSQLANSPSYSSVATAMGYQQNQEQTPEEAAAHAEQLGADQAAHSQEGGNTVSANPSMGNPHEVPVLSETEKQHEMANTVPTSQVNKIGGGYSRVSDVFGRKDTRPQQPSDQVHHNSSGGYTYVSNLGSGDSRKAPPTYHLGNKVFRKDAT